MFIGNQHAAHYGKGKIEMYLNQVAIYSIVVWVVKAFQVCVTTLNLIATHFLTLSCKSY